MKIIKKFEVRFKFNASDEEGSVTVYASDAGAASNHIRDAGVGREGRGHDEFIIHAKPQLISVTEIPTN